MANYPFFHRNSLASDEGVAYADPYDQQMAGYDDYIRNLIMRDQQMPASGMVMPDSGAIDPFQMQDFNNALLGRDRMKTRRAY